MIKVIINASPLIALSIIDKFELLAKLFGKIYIPNAVVEEILGAKIKKCFAKKELKFALENNIFEIYKVKNSQLVDNLFGKLHRGELEVIVGGQELDVDFAVIDEMYARNLSKTFGINTIGTIGILKLAKENGHISSIKTLLFKLKNNKFHISDKLIKKLLSDLNEN